MLITIRPIDLKEWAMELYVITVKQGKFTLYLLSPSVDQIPALVNRAIDRVSNLPIR